DEVLTGFLVDTSHEVRIFERELPKNLNQLGKIPVELRLYGYRDNRLGNIVYRFEGDELFHRGESFSGLHVLQPEESWNVTCAKMPDYLPLWPHVDSYLLDPPLRAGVDQKDRFAVRNRA